MVGQLAVTQWLRQVGSIPTSSTNPLMSSCNSSETLSVVSIVRVIPNTPIAATEGQDETLKALTENWKCNSSVGLVAPVKERNPGGSKH